MRLEIRYTTRYAYDPPVAGGLTAIRMAPRSRPGIDVRSAALESEPGRPTLSYVDGWGTRVHLIESPPHTETRCAMTAVVETGGEHIETTLSSSAATLYRRDSARVRREAVAPLLQQLALSHRGWSSVETLVTCLGQWFTYRVGVTDAMTNMESVIDSGEGVCQDLAHIMIAALRSWGWCARYVSGYVYTNGDAPGRIEAAAMHAWVEVYREGGGWFGVDPTHGGYADDRYVPVAVGRDYDDVRPIRGVIVGSARQEHAAQLVIERPAEQ